jgi:hypothetical protein
MAMAMVTVMAMVMEFMAMRITKKIKILFGTVLNYFLDAPNCDNKNTTQGKTQF